jgi:hypothetical protein
VTDSFKPLPAGIRELVTAADEPVARDLLRRGVRIESQAKLNATGREYGDGSRGPRVRTGRLRTSIAHELGRDSVGLYVDVGTNVFYGRYLEEGTDRMRPYPFLVPAIPAGLT